jgi:hypothetical protein
VFCDKLHCSVECFLEQKIELSDKHQLLKKGYCCASCLKPGHVAKKCKAKSRCVVCGEGHVTTMCKEFKPQDNPHVPPDNHDVATRSLMDKPKVLLQTLKVRFKSDT